MKIRKRLRSPILTEWFCVLNYTETKSDMIYMNATFSRSYANKSTSCCRCHGVCSDLHVHIMEEISVFVLSVANNNKH